MGVLNRKDSKQELGFGSCVVSQKLTPSCSFIAYSFTNLLRHLLSTFLLKLLS